MTKLFEVKKCTFHCHLELKFKKWFFYFSIIIIIIAKYNIEQGCDGDCKNPLE